MKHIVSTLWPNAEFSSIKAGAYIVIGRAIAEAISRWLPTVASWLHARVWQVGFVVDRVASRQVFSKYFGFPCKNYSFHHLLHHHHIHPGQLAEALR
jgi:hypothetical protein